MRHIIPSLLVCCLASVVHAAPEAAQPLFGPPTKASVQIRLTEVLLPAGGPTTFPPVKDPQTGGPSDLLALQQAAVKAKVRLTITPGLVLTTSDGVGAILNMDTSLPYTVTDAQGKKQRVFQTLDNNFTALPRVNADGTITVTLKEAQSKVSGPPTMPDGPSNITTQAFSTAHTFVNGETKNVGGIVLIGRESHLVFATVTVVSPVK